MKRFKTAKGNSVYFGDNTPFVIEEYTGEYFLYVVGRQYPLHPDDAAKLKKEMN